MASFTALTSDGSPGWPLSHLAEHTTEHATAQDEGKQVCVLLATGAMSPIHRGHVAMMVHAKAALEREGWAVLGGFVSPSHDLYVGPKARRKRTPFVTTPAQQRFGMG